MESPVYRCNFCKVVKFSIKKYLSHLELCHQHSPDFIINCGLDNCRKNYKSVASLRNHYYRCHKELIINQSQGNQTLDNVNDYNPPASYDSDSDQADAPDYKAGEHVVLSIDDLTKDLKSHVVDFILKLQEKHVLPKVVQETVVNDIRCLFKTFISNYSGLIKFHLDKAGFCIESDSDLEYLLQNEDLFEAALDCVSTEYKLESYCKDSLGLVKPVEHILGHNGTKAESFQYVPILDVLKQVLEKNDVWECFQRYNNRIATVAERPDSVLEDYTDGSIFKEHRLFQGDPHLIRIHLYTDEFEVVNPLGSKKLLHKVCAFYFSIGNLEPKYRSHLRHIHLAILARYKLVQKYTYSDILKPLIEDLKKLQTTGLSVTVDGHVNQLYGGLATISSDNLSAHSLGGFVGNFNSGRICRFCMALHSEIGHKFCEEAFTPRTSLLHQYHLSALSQNPTIAKNTYGVVSTCPFTELDYFDVTQSFPPDIMHDILEGVVPRLLILLIQSLHKDGHVSVQNLNAELTSFSFGKNDRDHKPVKIPEARILHPTASLPGKAVEKWCLFRILPNLIGQYVPEDYAPWQLYLTCRELTEIVLAPAPTKSDAAYLRILVTDFMDSFQLLYPDKFTPKIHFLVHYPRLLNEYGSLKMLWCMRFEGKHQYFKKLAGVVCNFKNICLTLARRHQLRLCWELTSVDLLKQGAVSMGGRAISLRALCSDARRPLLLACAVDPSDVDLKETVWKVTQLSIDNIIYKEHDIYIIDLVHDDVPVFLKVVYIMQFRSSWLLCGKLLIPDSYVSHLHGYNVHESHDWIVIHPGQQIDYHPLDAHRSEGLNGYMISLRHKPHKVITENKGTN